ncbi:MAG: outer membrane lipoprotein-sorting protein [Bacteroidota bacterium]
MMKKIKLLLLLAFSSLYLMPLSAQDETALLTEKEKVDPSTATEKDTDTKTETRPQEDMAEVLKQADFYRGGQLSGISWDLKVDNYVKGKLKNEITIKVEASSFKVHQFALATFKAPRKYKGQKLLVRDNNMWFSKPGLRQPVAISSRQRLSGTAANADIASANYYNDYDIVEESEGELDGQPCWILELEAKNNLVSYPRVKYWISKTTQQGLKTEFYGKSKKLIKTATYEYENVLEYKKVKYAFISRVNIFDRINKEDKTILNVSNIKVDRFSNAKFQKNRLLD